MKTIIAATLAVMAELKTAATIKLVDAVRLAAHKAGELTPEDEAKFQQQAARYGGHLVKWHLCPLQKLSSAPQSDVVEPPPTPEAVETPPTPVQPELPAPSKKRGK